MSSDHAAGLRGQATGSAGLVDEIGINLVPVLLGGGTPLFEEGEQAQLELVEVVDTPLATHLRYRVPS